MLPEFCYSRFTKVNNLRHFLRRHELPTSGQWEGLVQVLDENLSNGLISREEFRHWFRHAVHGGLKHLYIFTLDDARDYSYFETAEGLQQRINETPELRPLNIDEVDRPEYRVPIYAEVVGSEQNEDLELRLGFVEKAFKAEDSSPMGTNYYVFADICPSLNQLVIWVPSTASLFASEALEERLLPDKVARRYAKFLCECLELRCVESANENARVAYNIWHSNSDTPQEIKDQVASIADVTSKYLRDVGEILRLQAFDTELMFGTIQSLWEGALVLVTGHTENQNDFNPKRRGIVKGSDFGDRAGAVGKTNTSYAAEGTELHYVLRGLMEQAGYRRFTQVRIDWYSNDPKETIRSDVTAFSDCLRVRFSGTMLEEEEIRHVLSCIRSYQKQT